MAGCDQTRQGAQGGIPGSLRPLIPGQISLTPRVKDQQRPQHLPVVPGSAEMFRHEARDGLGIEQADTGDTRGRQTFFERTPQRTAEPLTDRDPEALFPTCENRAGSEFFRCS